MENLCDGHNYPAQLKNLKDIFISNGFSEKSIRKALTNSDKSRRETEYKGFSVLPYIKGITDVISRILKKHHIRPIFKPIIKIKDLLPSPKGRIPAINREGVYRVESECGDVYIGQTGRSMSCRLKEHERNIRLGQPEKSTVTEHAIGLGHQILWNQTKVIKNITAPKPRIFREALEIIKHPSNFNREDAIYIFRTWEILLKDKFKIPPKTTQVNKQIAKSETDIPKDPPPTCLEGVRRTIYKVAALRLVSVSLMMSLN
jgi:hypothetical protein